MNGQEFLRLLPPMESEEREACILKAVGNGLQLPIEWCAVTSSTETHSCVFYVASDALRIGETSEDAVRVNVSHTGAQRIADLLGCALPTKRISDLIHVHADVHATPCVSTPDAQMSSTQRMGWHSNAVSGIVGNRKGLVSTVGKDWVLTNRLVRHPDMGANYGWHVRYNGPIPGCSIAWDVLQPLGTVHNRWHSDYSQVLRLVHRRLRVDGADMLLEDVLTDPELAPLLSNEGALQITRHPGVPLEVCGEAAPLPCGSFT